MRDANFLGVFVGIERPDPMTLTLMKKKQKREILLDYKSILERIFDPAAYAKRLDRLVSLVDCSGRPRKLPEGDLRSKCSSLDRIHRILSEQPTREPFRKVLTNCINTNPAVISYIVC